MEIKELPEERKIRWVRLALKNQYYRAAKTGPFKGNRFKIKARNLIGHYNTDDWEYVYLALVDSRTSVEDCY